MTGLQLAIRTDRLTGLIAGGFPMLNGPYAEMLRLTTAVESGTAKGFSAPPEVARQFRTYYEGLRSFDDRAAQAKIKCPRFTFAGTADVISLNDEVLTNIGQSVVDHRAELEQLGWTVKLVEGLNHVQALAPTVVIPLIRDWLKTHWRE